MNFQTCIRPFTNFVFLLRHPGMLRYVRDCYSQEGEDMILSRLLGNQRRGFYVDVGAHHPYRFSNTFHYYLRGWRGINIEPNPELLERFSRLRNRDINLTCGISDVAGELPYYQFNEPALNTFDEGLARRREAGSSYRIVDTRIVEVLRLEDVLSRHLPPGTSIDFMTIDVEGLDLRVLQSNDWTKFRPRYVLVEALREDLESVLRTGIHKLMKGLGYALVAKTVNTCFYSDNHTNGS